MGLRMQHDAACMQLHGNQLVPGKCRRAGQSSHVDAASQSAVWLDDHTRRLVEDIVGLTGVEDVVLTIREDAPARLTREQVR